MIFRGECLDSKSQTEWLDVWRDFVVRTEAEIGRSNCISWLLTDNGGVYVSNEMKAFCASKGIQHTVCAVDGPHR